ncbi:hypothetical protein HDV01_006288 [Terramyces sp. JEL0728]|nr:hypothetical protein HDV01_006288 [Terramyces sp. JEL0728]
MLLATFILNELVNAHGFLVHPGTIGDAKKYHAVRNYDAISIDIQSLRGPDSTRQFCRGAAKGPVTPITLQNGQPFTVTCAFSMNAFHVGPCSAEIIDADDTNSIVEIGNQMGCARPPFAKLNTDGLVGHPATLVCPDVIPTKLITNDMCLSEWTFTVTNADQIKCKNCILRWNWEARHISTPGEFYQNCADVDVTVIGGPQKQGKGPVQAQVAPVQSVVNNFAQLLQTPTTIEPAAVTPANGAPVVDTPANLAPLPVIFSLPTSSLPAESEAATFGQYAEYTIVDGSDDFETVPQITLDNASDIQPTRAVYVSSSLQLASGIITGLFIILAFVV